MRLKFLAIGLLFASSLWAQQPVAVQGVGSIGTSDAAWTSGTAGNTAVTLISNSSLYNTIEVTLVQGTTITGGVVTFESSTDNSTWISVQGVTIGTTTIMGPTYTLVASTNVAFLFPVNAPYFRVRLSTVIAGTGTVTIQHASQTLPAVGLLAGSETLAAGTNVIGHVIADTGSTTAVTQGTGTNLHVDVDTALPTGTNTLGSVKLTDGTTVPGVIAGTTALKTDLSSVAGTATSTAASGVQLVGIEGRAGTSMETTAGVLDNNVKNIGNAAVSTAASGVQKVGIVGNAGAAVDAATNGAIPTNQVWVVSAPTTAAGGALSSVAKATVTSSVSVKASAGSVYGISVLNGAGSGCWLELINSASAGTLGTAVIFNIALPTSGTITIPPGVFALGNFSNGIAVGAASAIGGASACGTAVTGVTVFYQ